MDGYGDKIVAPRTLGGALGMIDTWQKSRTETYGTHEVAEALRGYVRNAWNRQGSGTVIDNHPDDEDFIYALEALLNKKMDDLRRREKQRRLQPKLFFP